MDSLMLSTLVIAYNRESFSCIQGVANFFCQIIPIVVWKEIWATFQKEHIKCLLVEDIIKHRLIETLKELKIGNSNEGTRET